MKYKDFVAKVRKSMLFTHKNTDGSLTNRVKVGACTLTCTKEITGELTYRVSDCPQVTFPAGDPATDADLIEAVKAIRKIYVFR